MFIAIRRRNVSSADAKGNRIRDSTNAERLTEALVPGEDESDTDQESNNCAPVAPPVPPTKHNLLHQD
jgi:hypothetical protein